MVVQKLRQKYSLEILLSVAQLPRATFYYHLKKQKQADKYETSKAEIKAIFHENKGRYGYRRITVELRNRLPRYMIPNLIIKLDSIPMTANGKIDRVSLKKMYSEQ